MDQQELMASRFAAMDAFLDKGVQSRTMSPETARAVRRVVREFDATPKDIRELLVLLAQNRDMAARDVHLRDENPYVNAELGAEGRSAYLEFLRARLRRAQAMMEAVQVVMDSQETADAAEQSSHEVTAKRTVPEFSLQALAALSPNATPDWSRPNTLRRSMARTGTG